MRAFSLDVARLAGTVLLLDVLCVLLFGVTISGEPWPGWDGLL